jgi:guanine deaminase
VTYRAAVLDPVAPDEVRCLSDAAVTVSDGVITAVRPIDQHQRTGEVIALDGVLIPGLVDTHIHWVQHHVRGAFRADLLDWLHNHIWPEETALGRPETAAGYARAFFRDTARAGTTLGMAYSSAHPAALEPAFEAAIGDWLIGNVVMPTGAPDALCSASVSRPEDVVALIKRYGVDHYPLTPRFALNCDSALLAGLGRIAHDYGAWIQTHLAESPHEVARVKEAFPDARDYTDVYDRARLLTPRTVLGHCIHLSEREFRCLARRGCWIAHCPSSNEALGSGRMDLSAVRHHGIPFALGSDVGAGPSHSMLHVMQRFLDLQRDAGERVTATEALYRATAAGADCLGRGGIAGRIASGRRADFVLMPAPDGPLRPEAWLEALTRGQPGELETRPLGTWVGGEPAA